MNGDPQQLDKLSDHPWDPAARQLSATAYHEAGHAVMPLSLGRLIQKVTIVPGKTQFGGVQLGTCEFRQGDPKPPAKRQSVAEPSGTFMSKH